MSMESADIIMVECCIILVWPGPSESKQRQLFKRGKPPLVKLIFISWIIILVPDCSAATNDFRKIEGGTEEEGGRAQRSC